MFSLFGVSILIPETCTIQSSLLLLTLFPFPMSALFFTHAAYSSTFNMEAAGFSATTVPFYQNT
jgi:hypothetical protein